MPIVKFVVLRPRYFLDARSGEFSCCGILITIICPTEASKKMEAMEYLGEQNFEQVEITGSALKTNETCFTIKHLADFSGIKPHTIRIWEQRFALLKPQRTEASRRLYLPEQVDFFLQVCLLKQN